MFNVDKFHEFMYDTDLFNTPEDRAKTIEELMREQEERTKDAIFKEQHMNKRSKTLVIIEIVKDELNRRQQQGFIRKDFSEKDKNQVAMKFLDLFHKVRNN